MVVEMRLYEKGAVVGSLHGRCVAGKDIMPHSTSTLQSLINLYNSLYSCILQSVSEGPTFIFPSEVRGYRALAHTTVVGHFQP